MRFHQSISPILAVSPPPPIMIYNLNKYDNCFQPVNNTNTHFQTIDQLNRKRYVDGIDRSPTSKTMYNNLDHHPIFQRCASLSSGNLDNFNNNNHNNQSIPPRSPSPLLTQPTKRYLAAPQPESIFQNHGSYDNLPLKSLMNISNQQQKTAQAASFNSLFDEAQHTAREFQPRNIQLEQPASNLVSNFAPLTRRHTTNERLWAKPRNLQGPSPSTQKQNNINSVPFDMKRREQAAQSAFLSTNQIEPSFGRDAITPPPGRILNDHHHYYSNQNSRSITPEFNYNNHPNVRIQPHSQEGRKYFSNSNLNLNRGNSSYSSQQPIQLVVIKRSPLSQENLCLVSDF